MRAGHTFARIPVFPAGMAAEGQPTEEREGWLRNRIRGAMGRGRSLDPGAQRRLEESLDADLSGVRVHTDGEADALSRSVGAAAFTTGLDIFFRHGLYSPHGRQGFHLLAHEVAHAVQQAAGPVAGAPAPGGIWVSHPSDVFERSAAATADRVSAERGSPSPSPKRRARGVRRVQHRLTLQRVLIGDQLGQYVDPGQLATADLTNLVNWLQHQPGRGRDHGIALQVLQRRQAAIQIVQDFAQQTAPLRFAGVTRPDIAARLQATVDDVTRIDQGEFNLCGPSTFLMAIAMRDPEAYVRYVIQVAETGTGAIGGKGVLAGHDVTMKPLPQSGQPRPMPLLQGQHQMRHIDRTDWIALASLRDTDNWLVSAARSDNILSGATFPNELASWFEQYGVPRDRIINDASLQSTKNWRHLEGASNLFQQGYIVILLVDLNIFDFSGQGINTWNPIKAWHWVMLSSPITRGQVTLHGNPRITYTFLAHTWGVRNLTGRISGEKLSSSYFGYVAARMY